MYKNCLKFVVLFSIILNYSGCITDPIPETDQSPYRYYPLSVGKYFIYHVDSIYYTDFVSDTVHLQIKELIVDTFYDATSRLNYRIQRFSRANDTCEWALTAIWSVLQNNEKIERDEGNLRFIKLASPLIENGTWQGNSYLGGLESLPYNELCNQLTFLYDWTYSYYNVNKPILINGIDFDNTVTVLQYGNSNLIEYNSAKEIYAENIGMVSKEFYHYTNNTSVLCDTCHWQYHVSCGYSVTMQIIDFN